MPDISRVFHAMTLWLFLSVGLCVAAVPGAHAEISATDVTGRTIALAQPARRIVLAQGRQLPALAIVVRDPTDVLIGMGGDWKRQDAESFARYEAAFPKLKSVATVGAGSGDTLSVERIVSLEPDLVILSRNLAGKLDENRTNALIRQIEAAGAAVAIIDFYAHPLDDTAPSLLTLGRLVGREQEAQDYVAFYRAHLAEVRDALGAASVPKPNLFMQAHSGATPCCYAPGRGALSDMIAFAGANSVSASMLPGMNGQLSPERLMTEEIDLFVATGGTYQKGKGGVVLGTGVSGDQARESLQIALGKSPLAELSPVRRGRAFGLWQLFNDTPLNVLAVEVLAKWAHPGLFEKLRPEQTLEEINRRFLAVPFSGTYWTN